MHSVLYAFPSRVFFLWFIQKFDDFCYLLPGVEVGKLAGIARTEALLELGHRLIHLTSRLSATLGVAVGK